MKVLIVDDDPDVLRMLVRMLQHRGHSVQSCSSPFGVSVMVLRDPPDLVVLDVMMPGLDGPQLAEVLRGLPIKRRPSVVLWSAMDDDQLKKLNQQTGLPVLPKTTSPTELIGKLEQIVARRPPD